MTTTRTVRLTTPTVTLDVTTGDADALCALLNDDVTVEIIETRVIRPAIVAAPKRKPGRPRKVAVGTETALGTETAILATPRKRKSKTANGAVEQAQA